MHIHSVVVTDKHIPLGNHFMHLSQSMKGRATKVPSLAYNLAGTTFKICSSDDFFFF